MDMAQADRSVDEKSFGSRLRRADIERSRRWGELLRVGLTSMPANALGRSDIETLGELADALDAGEVVDIYGIGAVGRAKIAGEFERLLEQGREVYLYGRRGRPSTVRELLDQGLELLDERTACILRRYCFEGENLREIGGRLDLTRERIRQLKEEGVGELALRFGDVARELVGGVLESLDRSGGLLRWARIERGFAAPAPSLAEVVLVCRLAGAEGVDEWDQTFLVDHRCRSPEELLGQLADFLRGRPGPEVSLEAVDTWAERKGLCLDDRSAAWLAKRAVGLDLSDGPVRVPWWTGRDALLAALERTETPADVTDIRRAYESIRQTYLSLPEFTDHAVRNRLQESDEVYNYDHGVYIHVADLPVPPQVLEEAADRVVDRLDGKTDAVSIETLLAELRETGVLSAEVTPHMLKTVLTERPEVETFRNTMLVADRDSFEHDDVAMVDRIERVLRRADEPMSTAELTEALSEYSYAKSSVGFGVWTADFALRWERGRYFHRDKLALGRSEADVVVDACHECLPDDGEPRTADWVCGRLDPEIRQLRDGSRPPPQVLWALAGNDERLDTGCIRLVARGAEGNRSLLRPRLLRAVEAVGPADRRTICEYLRRQFGPFDAVETISNMLQNLRRSGRIACDDRRFYRVREA